MIVLPKPLLGCIQPNGKTKIGRKERIVDVKNKRNREKNESVKSDIKKRVCMRKLGFS